MPAGAPAQSGAAWTGTFSTTYGNMTLTQSGARVAGTYDHEGGQISGTVSGRVLTGQWTELPTRAGPSDAGTIQFTLSADGNSFSGLWNYASETTLDRGWAGTRTGLPEPVIGKSVNATVVAGTVLIRTPGSARAAQAKGQGFVPLTAARQIPVGSLLDTSRGVVQLVSAADKSGRTQNGNFSQGVFQVLQSRKTRITELRLKGGSFSGCGKANRSSPATASRSKRRIRRLRAKAKGRFRTRGRHSAATVRGTGWDTIDRCDGTLTRVKRGRVAVRDIRKRKTVLVRAGKSYLAKAP